jgi:predicted nuclease of restriction endonuclease-like (RecB) superfamily
MSDKQQRKQRGESSNPAVMMPTPTTLSDLPANYPALLDSLRKLVGNERLRIVQRANQQMILLYWQIGQEILQQQQQEGWGAKVIDRLAYDLKQAFPEMSGFSPRNLKYMRKFAENWDDRELVQRTVALISWRSNIVLLDKLHCSNERLWYASRTLEYGWSRDILYFQIENRLHLRQGQSQNNFPATLPPEQSDMAVQLFKDPYLFDFLGTDAPRREAELEQQLIHHLEKFLVELGQGFAFVGRQVHLEVGDEDFYADLLFYHLKLRCYVVVELKMGKFTAGFVSQLQMYQTIIDEQLRHPDDQPTIGLLLVKEKNNLIVEYALASYNKPIGVAEWQQQLTRTLPEELKTSLPSIEEIERELQEKEQQIEEKQGLCAVLHKGDKP